MPLPSKRFGERKRQHRDYWKPSGPLIERPSPVVSRKSTDDDISAPRTCQKCQTRIRYPYVTCFPCYDKLDPTAKSRIRQQWGNRGRWAR